MMHLITSNNEQHADCALGMIDSALRSATPTRVISAVTGEAISQKNRKLPVADKTLQLIFNRYPSESLQGMNRGWWEGDNTARSNLEIAAYVIEDYVWKQFRGLAEKEDRAKAMKSIDELSKNDMWWVRLYVAEMLWRHDSLRTKEILNRLREDTDPYVKQAASREGAPGMTKEKFDAARILRPGYRRD